MLSPIPRSGFLLWIGMLLVLLRPGTGLAAEGAGSPITMDTLCAPAAGRAPLAAGNPAPSTRRMAELLAAIREQMNPVSAGYLSDRLARLLETRLATTTNLTEKLQLLLEL